MTSIASVDESAEPRVNLTALVLRNARSRPDQLALVVPTLSEDGTSYAEASLSFGALAARISQAMTGLEAPGFITVGRSDRAPRVTLTMDRDGGHT